MTFQLKVIVAEENPIQRAYLTQLVQKLGYQAIAAEDGLQALQSLRSTNAQILLSSYQMSDMNGIQLTQEVRKLDLGYYVHVIMVTATDEDGVRSEALDAGVDDFLTKSGSPIRLKARIRTATRLINHAMELAERTRILKDYNDRIREDLAAAANAQRQLLPDIQSKILGFRIASAFVPSSLVSGDMFGCFELSSNKFGFYAVDVSGHGVHASLLSVAIGHLITPEFFQTKALKLESSPDPAALVYDLNYRFSAGDNDDYFSMFCGVMDTNSGQLDYCQAGSPSPFYVDQTGKTQAVGDGGFLVGMFNEAPYENKTMHIELGASLVLCSDAASEAENATHGPFGTERLRNIVSKTPRVGADKIPEKIIQALSTWREGELLEDDLTIVALERTI